MDVQELLRWQAVRGQLHSELGRQPDYDEWARAVGFHQGSFQGQLKNLQRAKDTMVTSNMRLVVSVAKPYLNRGVTLPDLIQEGTLGLITAVEKFDVE